MHYAKTGSEMWDDTWITDIDMVGSGGNARYVHTIAVPLSAEVGEYDLRIKWTDAGGQSSAQ